MMEQLESSRNIGAVAWNKPFCDGWRTGKMPMLYNLAVGTQVLRDLTLLSRITHWTCFESYACRNVYGILWIDF